MEAITDYIGHHNPAAAARLVDDILDRTNALLSANPAAGRTGRTDGTREFVLSGTPYIVVYRVRDCVEVLAVIHGARQWPDDF
ncbi:plasmid stabilization system protein ParE [Methylorubrum rhodinum]|uniref:Plasmid stabilization system protein ParE n=1 Tax=Methylorubrum rhodinum TaxID=29428 RepID=A0A840ZIA6_9HYPH|nr:plasmid stabilization system protein ParE [Methylorubrum rhodinum]